MSEKGVKVKLWHNLEGRITLETLRNVTEIHYNYRRRNKSGGEVMVAFESDVHGTGVTHWLANVVEFEAVQETEIANRFSTIDRIAQH